MCGEGECECVCVRSALGLWIDVCVHVNRKYIKINLQRKQKQCSSTLISSTYIPNLAPSHGNQVSLETLQIYTEDSGNKNYFFWYPRYYFVSIESLQPIQ